MSRPQILHAPVQLQASGEEEGQHEVQDEDQSSADDVLLESEGEEEDQGDEENSDEEDSDTGEPVQKASHNSSRGGAAGTSDSQTVAAAGVRDASSPLPYADTIQASFGAHGISDVKAQVGGSAAKASTALRADAYTTGDRIGFQSTPDLRLAAHEATHVVQQRAGVQLKGGVGRVDDQYERHADQVADLVVSGESAESLLDTQAPHRKTVASSTAVQKRGKKPRRRRKVKFETATKIIEAVYKLVNDSNVDGKLTPKSFAGVGAFSGALWDFWYARTGKAPTVFDPNMAMPMGERLTHLSAGLRKMRPLTRVVKEQGVNGGAWVQSLLTKPCASLKRDILVGTFKECGWVATQAAYIMDNPSALWLHKTRPDASPMKYPRYAELLWRVWCAVAGVPRASVNGGPHTQLSNTERHDLLNQALGELEPLLAVLREGGAKKWVDAQFQPSVAKVRSVLAYRAAEAHVLDIHRAQEAQRDGKQSPVADERVQVQAACLNAQSAFRQIKTLMTVYGRMQGGKMEAALKASMARLATEDPRLVVIKDMPVTQAIRHLQGLIGGVLAVYNIADPDERKKEAAKRGNILSRGTDLAMNVTAIMGGSVSAASLMVAGFATLAGKTALASQALALGSRSIRIIGQVGAVFQLVYGIADMLDPDSTGADRKSAMLNIGMGAAGTLGLLKTMGVSPGGLTSWGGPLTIGVIVTALEMAFVMSAVGGFERGWMNGTLGQAYRNLAKRGQKLQAELKMLHIPLALADAVQPSSEAELAVFRQYEAVAKNYGRDAMEEAYELLEAVEPSQKASYWLSWQHPGNHPPIRKQFEAVRAKYNSVEGPRAQALYAAELIMVTHKALSGARAHVCKELTSAHGDSILFGGLHDGACKPKGKGK